MSALGHHVLLDLTGIDPETLEDVDGLRALLERAACAGGATVVSSHFHRFEPQGVSGIVILAESHLAIHAWPELGHAAVDVFTCGAPEIAEAVAREIRIGLGASHHEARCIRRNVLAEEALAASDGRAKAP